MALTPADRRARYRHDDAYRLLRINHARKSRGAPTIDTLADAYKRVHGPRLRGSDGRFISDGEQNDAS